MLVAWVEPDFVELEICIIKGGMEFKKNTKLWIGSCWSLFQGLVTL